MACERGGAVRHRAAPLLRSTALILPLLLTSLGPAQAAQKPIRHGMGSPPAPSLFFDREHAAAIESAARRLPISSAQASGRLTLESLVYWGPEDWTVWIQGKKWTEQDTAIRSTPTNDVIPVPLTNDLEPPGITIDTDFPATRRAEPMQEPKVNTENQLDIVIPAKAGIQGTGDRPLNEKNLSNETTAPFRILSVGPDYVVLTARLRSGQWTAPTRLSPMQSVDLVGE